MRLRLHHDRRDQEMRHLLLVAGLGWFGCGSDLRLHTHAFVAGARCGQGPYDIHLVADGKTGEEGVEVIACTPRRLSGHVVFEANHLTLANQPFGDVADNQRCLAGAATITATAAATDGGNAASAGGTGGPATTAPQLVEQPYRDDEDPFADKVCGRLGLTAQTVLMTTVLQRTDNFLPAGADLHVRLWSDAPNDLEGVVFLIRHATSTKTPAQVAKDEAKWQHAHPQDPRRKLETTLEPPHHGPPPAPLAEQQPPQPRGAEVSWVPGYWTWTGAAWGWIAGFWRDARFDRPAPQVEIPGAPPAASAIWIGGSWELRGRGYVWIGGRWRR